MSKTYQRIHFLNSDPNDIKPVFVVISHGVTRGQNGQLSFYQEKKETYESSFPIIIKMNKWKPK